MLTSIPADLSIIWGRSGLIKFSRLYLPYMSSEEELDDDDNEFEKGNGEPIGCVPGSSARVCSFTIQ